VQQAVEQPWTIRRLLEWTSAFFTRKGLDSPRLCAELLLAHVLDCPRIKLYTDFERTLTDHHLSTYRALVKRAAEEEPIAYLTGVAPFFNLDIAVTRDVLIPRPDTETLVENVIQTVRTDSRLTAQLRILDLCTGSGCIALSLAKALKESTVIATDISPQALAVAQSNAQRLKLDPRTTFLEGDLFAALRGHIEDRPFDIITANPPYIPTANLASLDRSVKDYEPHLALDGGLDGLSPHRAILAKAPEYLAPGGRLYLEIQFDQGPAALALAAATPGLQNPNILRDLAGHDRVLTATRA
jgi:release factor glutamine methyltransferase